MTKEERDRNKRFWALPVEERQKELVRRVNAAFGMQLTDHREALAAMRVAVADQMTSPDAGESHVPAEMGCPQCGCRDIDELVHAVDGCSVTCQRCGKVFDPMNGSEVRS